MDENPPQQGWVPTKSLFDQGYSPDFTAESQAAEGWPLQPMPAPARANPQTSEPADRPWAPSGLGGMAGANDPSRPSGSGETRWPKRSNGADWPSGLNGMSEPNGMSETGATSRLTGLDRPREASRLSEPGGANRARWPAQLSWLDALSRAQSPARLGSGPVRTGRLWLGRYRRPLTAALVLSLLWITLRSALPSPPAGVAVLVATRDLPAGKTLVGEDVRTDRRPAEQVPGGRLTSATGRTLSTPVRSGELITDTRVVGPGLLLGQPLDTVAVPVRLGDPAAAGLVRPGDRIDLLASTASASSMSPEDATASASEPIATRALVLAAPGPADDDDGSTGAGSSLGELAGGALSGPSTGTSSGLLVLAVSTQEARRLAAAQSGRYLAIAVRP